jgi:hypothetical protein
MTGLQSSRERRLDRTAATQSAPRFGSFGGRHARALPLVVVNSARAIEDATRRSLSATNDAEALASLVELPGIVPIASALLHFARPDLYLILDYRALRSLGHGRRTRYPIAFGARYFVACRELRDAHASPPDLRTLDKALWTFDMAAHPPKLHRRRACTTN